MNTRDNMISYMLLLIFVKTDATIIRTTSCAKFGKICDPFFIRPCCNFNYQCKRLGWGLMQNTYICMQPLKLNYRCQYNLDCLNVDFVECKNNRCECLPNYVQVDNLTCATHLDGICRKDENCMTPNSACIGGKCQCNPSYIRTSNQECVPTSLGKKCTRDFHCNATENLKCSNQHECICNDNYVKSNNLICKPLLGEHCKEDSDCIVEYSVCKNSKCQCKNEFIPQSNDNCEATPLGRSCNVDSDCSDILHVKCSKTNSFKTCTCMENYEEINKTKCEPHLGEYCWNNERCAAPNSICNNKKECQCKSGFVPLAPNKCIKSPAGSDCRYDSDCSKILRQTYCSHITKKCICMQDFAAKDGVSCLQALGDYCYNDSQCGSRFSTCINHQCRCQYHVKPQSVFEC